MKFLRFINLAAALFFIVNGKTDQVQVLGLLLLPLAVISILFHPDNKKEKK